MSLRLNMCQVSYVTGVIPFLKLLGAVRKTTEGDGNLIVHGKTRQDYVLTM